MDIGYIYNLGIKFNAVAEQYSERCAIIWDDETKVNFRELNALSNRISNYLLGEGIKKYDVVAIQNNKSIYGFATMLACIKIGAIYTNFDFTNPAERIRKIFNTATPMLVVADEQNDLVDGLCLENGYNYVVLSNEVEKIELCNPVIDDSVISSVTRSDPAYIMFTSGSTGIPKGVLISQGSLLDFISWGKETYELKEDDILTNVNPIYFDNSVFDFYCSVFNGIPMLALAKSIVEKPGKMLEIIDRVGCTLWFSVPSLLIYLTNLKLIGPNTLQSIRIFAFGGEGYPKELLRKLYNVYGKSAVFFNVYGPTEGTCICSAYEISPEDMEADGLAPLGKIAHNFNFLVLDENDTISKEGELCLIGTQLAIGYYNDEERTRKSFVNNPIQKRYSERMYRTGDRVEIIGEKLFFRGRVDNQIKHMGYRIELEEIESAMIRIKDVKQCAAIHTVSKNGFSKLIGYIATDVEMEESIVKEELKEKLPVYMIPNQIIFMKELPKNQNGKVDRVKLRVMG